MPVLANYNAFVGRHWETGTIANVLAYQGITGPHTGQLLTEALLLGVSGGLVAGYFAFEYEGLDPWLHFLTRNTFDPMQTILERLGIPSEVKQTASADKAVSNLLAALEAGRPAIVWADATGLAYNNMPGSSDNWMMLPLVVYGYDAAAGLVYVADRSEVALTASVQDFAAARARTDKNKHRMMTLGAPDLERLGDAVEASIRASVAGFLDEPPLKPLRGKYGLAAYTRWAELLTSSRGKTSWAKQFAPGRRMLSGLTTAYQYIHLWGTGGNGSRGQYAVFLDEVADLLAKPDLRDIAGQFRTIEGLWHELLQTLLPEEIAPLKETRELMQRQHDLFIAQGAASLDERRQISARLEALKSAMAVDFPLTEAESGQLRENLAARVLAIRDAEQQAWQALCEMFPVEE